jgi:hypothetical protein
MSRTAVVLCCDVGEVKKGDCNEDRANRAYPDGYDGEARHPGPFAAIHHNSYDTGMTLA